MSYLYDIDPRHYAALLAADEPRVYDPQRQPAPGTILADPSRRTILIGLGGMGVQSIDRIKGTIREQFQPGWEQHVGFLAVDTDRHELNGCRHLSRGEMVCLSRPGLADTVHAGPAAWPRAWRAIADERTVAETMEFGGMGNGTSGKRLVGRLKLHDQAPDQMPFDQQVTARLRDQAYGMMTPPAAGGAYDVYVIGSLCGGTGSGMFLDFPALIRHALGPHDVNIHAMLYLPEVFAPIAPHFADRHQANAYGAWKELEYYQGLPARQGYRETWPYSDPAMPELELDGSTGLFRSVRLVGAAPAAGTGSLDQAMDTVRTYLLHELADHAPPFIPAGPIQTGHEGEYGRLRHYIATSSARAALPRAVLRSYVIGRICKDAGLKPVSEAEYAALAAKGAAPLPFLGEHQDVSAPELENQAAQLLQPLVQFVGQFHARRDFSYEKVFGQMPTWEEIRSGEADAPHIRMRTDHEIARLTAPDTMERLRGEVAELFRQFRNNVQRYVEQHGPMAFVNLFEGRSGRYANGDLARGIRERLIMLRDGLRMETGSPNIWLSPGQAQERLREVIHEIQREQGGILGQIMNQMTGRQDEQAAMWCQAYDNLANARIAEVRRSMMLGMNGFLNRCFLEPAAMLAQELYAFGKVLETMTDLYTRHGAALENFAEFQLCCQGMGSVNIGGRFPEVYEELRREMDLAAAQHNPFVIRQGLVADFFDDPARWMEVNDDNVERWHGGICLHDSARPVAARHAFDRCVDDRMIPVPPYPVIRLYQLAQGHGISEYVFAHGILTELDHLCRSALGNMPSGIGTAEIVYPARIHTWSPALSAAIQNAAQNIFGWNVSFRLSYDEESITLRWNSEPFEIHRLHGLPQWEAEYECRLQMPGKGLHGYSPDIRRSCDGNGVWRYQEMTPWADYPGLVYRCNPTAPDPGMRTSVRIR